MTPSTPLQRPPARSGKFLVFVLGAEEYAIEIESVREIVPNMPITRVPRTSHAMLGVVNLRGKIIPVLDLHCKLQLPRPPISRDTCVVVMTDSADRHVGVVVDRVREVVGIAEAQIMAPPSFGADVGTKHLAGIATGAGTPTRMLLAIDELLHSDTGSAARNLLESETAPKANS